MPEDLRSRVGAVAERSGFVPNVFRALARRPAELRAFLDYHDALMDKTDGLSKAERELIVVATSGANRCIYCVVAHGAILRVRMKDPEIAERVATNPWGVELAPRERAIVDLALLLATDPASLTDAEFDEARAAGLTDDEILGHRCDHRTLRPVQPPRAPERAATEPGVLPPGTAAELARRAAPCKRAQSKRGESEPGHGPGGFPRPRPSPAARLAARLRPPRRARAPGSSQRSRGSSRPA